MTRFLVDEDFNNDIVRDAVLALAASEGRVLLTHDVSTLVGLAYERVRLGENMPRRYRRGAVSADRGRHR